MYFLPRANFAHLHSKILLCVLLSFSYKLAMIPNLGVGVPNSCSRGGGSDSVFGFRFRNLPMSMNHTTLEDETQHKQDKHDPAPLS